MKKGFKFTELIAKNCRDCQEVFECYSNKAFRCKSCQAGSDYRLDMLDYKWRLNKLVAMAKNRAKDKQLLFDLTSDYLIGLWDANKGKCAITLRSLDLQPYGKKGQVNPNAPSVDRIVPEFGYIKGNVRLITYHVNVALSEFGLDVLKELAKDVLRKDDK